MKWMLKARAYVRSFYEKYDRYLDMLIRFIFALSLFLTVMYFAGYNATMTNPSIAVIMAALCAFLPVSAVNVFTALLLLFEFSSVSLEVAAVCMIFFLLMLLMYFVFRAGNSWLLSLSLLLLLWNMAPMILPLALFINPVEIIVCAFGILVYAFIAVVRRDVSVLSSQTGKLNLGGRVNLLLSDIFTGNRFLLIIGTVCLGMIIIAVLRRSRMNYAAILASVIGGFVFIVGYLLGGYFLNVTINYGMFLLGTALAILFGAFIVYFVIAIDYRRTEEVQFEDDDYYYFVKAVPKRNITVTERRVESITGEPEQPELKLDDVFVHRDEPTDNEEE